MSWNFEHDYMECYLQNNIFIEVISRRTLHTSSILY